MRAFLLMPIVLAASTATAQERRPLALEAGHPVVIEDTIAGYDFLDFTVELTAGDSIAAVLATTNLAAYFNVLPPQSEQAIFIGSAEGDSFAATVETSGIHTVRVYMMRSAARRNETARFALAIAVPEPVADDADALVAQTPFHATAQVPCTAKDADQCRAGVVRSDGGDATVFLTDAGTGQRHWISFAGAKIVSVDGKETAADGASGDPVRVKIEGVTYDVPEALVTGG